MEPATDRDSISTVCLSSLQAAQNEDGGWGFHSGSPSRVEATCWALLALIHLDWSKEQLQAGIRFLRKSQLLDGSWPSAAGQEVGCWVTSLACWALLSDPPSHTAVAGGLRWICNDWPRGPTLGQRIQRLRSALAPRNQSVSQDDSLRGWGWTPDTASWVEPTAFGLIALDQAPRELRPNGADGRHRYARALLYDRMCPSGGWNCGNPMVYGVPGDPLIEPTVWALLSLRNDPDRRENRISLEWLENSLSGTLGAGSLALGKICLQAYGKPWPSDVPELKDLYGKNQFLGNIPVTAWTCLALSKTPAAWLQSREVRDAKA